MAFTLPQYTATAAESAFDSFLLRIDVYSTAYKCVRSAYGTPNCHMCFAPKMKQSPHSPRKTFPLYIHEQMHIEWLIMHVAANVIDLITGVILFSQFVYET